MVELTPMIILFKILVLGLGAVITHLAYRAYRRTRSPPLRLFTLGFGIITAGAMLGGGVDVIAGLGLELAVLVQSAVTGLGFAVLAYSLYAQVDDPVAS